MSATEFRRWQQFYAQEPVDGTATHVLLARIAAILQNANRGKNSQPVTAATFAPFLNRPQDDGEEGVAMEDLMGPGW